jgi:hypothetical protein
MSAELRAPADGGSGCGRGIREFNQALEQIFIWLYTVFNAVFFGSWQTDRHEHGRNVNSAAAGFRVRTAATEPPQQRISSS